MRTGFFFAALGYAFLAAPSQAAPTEEEFFAAMMLYPQAGDTSPQWTQFEGCDAHMNQPGYDCRYSLRYCVWNLDRTVHDCVSRRLRKRATLVGGDNGWVVLSTRDAY